MSGINIAALSLSTSAILLGLYTVWLTRHHWRGK